MNTNLVITDEMLSAYMAGNATMHETAQILRAAETDATVRETLRLLSELDAEEHQSVLPMMAMAADDVEQANRCAIRCEAYILRNIGIMAHVDDLTQEAEHNGWLHGEGMPIFNIGRLCESHGLTVTYCDECTIDDIVIALKNGQQVITLVDTTSDGIPNHSVVVTAVNDNTLTIFDPVTAPVTDIIPQTLFLSQWATSHYYMVIISE